MMAQSHTTMMAPQSQQAMQQQQESCKDKARIAAYVDIVLDVLGILFYIWGCYECIYFLRNAPSFLIDGWTYIVTFLCFLILVLHGVAIWLSVGLLNATKPTTAPNQALEKTKLWRLCFLIFLIILLVGGILLLASRYVNIDVVGGNSIFGAILRAPLLYIVHKFIQELQSVGGGVPMAGSSRSHQQPQNRKEQP